MIIKIKLICKTCGFITTLHNIDEDWFDIYYVKNYHVCLKTHNGLGMCEIKKYKSNDDLSILRDIFKKF